VREISEKYDLQVLRFFMLSAHYRSPLNFSADLMEASKNGLERILTAAERLRELQNKVQGADLSEHEQVVLKEQLEALVAKYEAAMEDDFNTADAISAIFELVKMANTEANEESSKAFVDKIVETLNQLCDVLGIITTKKEELLDSDIEELIQKRQQARKDKDFALADQIRDELAARGILLKDTREGVKWSRA
jgi:cysteinyl-tRNA synthetase